MLNYKHLLFAVEKTYKKLQFPLISGFGYRSFAPQVNRSANLPDQKCHVGWVRGGMMVAKKE